MLVFACFSTIPYRIYGENKVVYSKALICDDFRAVAISPILSKVFEYCILKRYETFLVSSDNQFGFKKGVGCGYAIRTVRGIVDVARDNTANLCAIDISKAFDRVNHIALLTKPMMRAVPSSTVINIIY